jgi:hypothetical protein
MAVAFLPVVFLVILFGVVYYVPKWVQRKKDNRQELINKTATVLSKRVNKTSKYIASYTYHVTFLFPDQSKLELIVPPKQLINFIEDDQGCLEFQGERFLSWSPNKRNSN